MPSKLPLTMKVLKVRGGPDTLEVDSVVYDATGQSVQAVPLTMNAKTTPAAACAMLQGHITQLAQAMYKHGSAELPALKEDEKWDYETALIGREFVGSVTT